MASVIYAIVFNGEIIEGFHLAHVKAQMGRMLKTDANKVQALFSGKTIVLKRTTDKAMALKYGSALKKIGANVRVKIIKSAASTTNVPAVRAPAAANTNPDFTLAANEGNLFDQKPPAPAPDLDLSKISVAENDGTPLVEPSVFEPAEIDLAEYTLKENDNSPLADPLPEVPRVESPDFGLDEPGALLETLKEEVELLDPDTSGMSLAFPGTDLLNEDEKQGPPPPAPDTSKIKLKSNFDI